MSDQPLPSTGTIRSCWVDACETCLKETMRDKGIPATGEQVRQMRNIARDLFDQWINQRDRKVKDKAWEEGYEAGCEDMENGGNATRNPYTEES